MCVSCCGFILPWKYFHPNQFLTLRRLKMRYKALPGGFMTALLLTLALAGSCVEGTRDYRTIDSETTAVYVCENGEWVHLYDRDDTEGPQDD